MTSHALSVKTAAAELELHEHTIRAAIADQALPAYRVGRSIRIERGDLIEWFRSLARVGSDEDVA